MSTSQQISVASNSSSMMEPIVVKKSIFSTRSHQKVEDALCKQVRDRDAYIAKLQTILRENEIEIPEPELNPLLPPTPPKDTAPEIVDASEEQIRILLERQQKYCRPLDITLEYTHLTYTVRVPEHRQIPSVSSVLKGLICFWTRFTPKKEIKILSDVTGRIKPRKMTLLIGPPGSGKSGKLFDDAAINSPVLCYIWKF